MSELKVEELFHHFIQIKPTQIEVLRNKSRLVAKIDTEDGSYYLKGEKQSTNYIQNIINFTTDMRDKGIPFIQFEKTIEGDPYLADHQYLYTLEKQAIGTEINQLNLFQIQNIGQLLGKQHAASEAMEYQFGIGTSWGMFGGNQSDTLGEYDENELSYNDFLSGVQSERAFPSEVREIQRLYESKREKLKSHWGSLPQGPVQGDFCPYNMFFNNQGKVSTIYDFNLAGDEVFLNECIGVGVYICWHYPFVGSQSEKERFEVFTTAYEAERPLSKEEKSLFHDLFVIIRAFRYDRVEQGIASSQLESFIKETLQLLQGTRVE